MTRYLVANILVVILPSSTIAGKMPGTRLSSAAHEFGLAL